MKQVINILKLKDNQQITQVANHNLRQVSTRNAVKSRTPDNHYLIGCPTTDTIAEMDKRLAKVPKFRKDAVKLVDLVLSASPEFFTDKKKTKEWETLTQQWAEDTFGKDNIIYSVVHYDEKTPHFHIALVPIFEGKLRASHWLDGPAKLKKIHDSYARVTRQLGLSRGSKFVKSTQTELEEFYKKVNSSTAYDRHLDKKLDDLFEKLDNPSFMQKLKPWSIVDEIVKPFLTQFSKNLSHYRTKYKEISKHDKEQKKELEDAKQKISTLELKLEKLGIDPDTPFLQLDKFQVIKPMLGTSANAPQEQPPRQGFEVKKPRPRFNH